MATKLESKSDIVDLALLQKQLYGVVQFVYPSSSQKSMQDQVDNCYKHLQKLQKSESSQTFAVEVKKMATTVTNAVALVDQLKLKGDPMEVMQASLTLFLSIVDLVENCSAHYDTATIALCMTYSGFFSLILPEQKETLPIQIHKGLTKALGGFNLPPLTQQIRGWSSLGKIVLIELEEQQNSNTYPGFDSAARSRLDSFVKLMGELEFLIECDVSDNESTQQRLVCICAYIYVAYCYIVILSWHLVLSTAAKIRPDMQIRRLSDMKCTSQSLFGFLSDKTLLGRAGAYGGKLRTMAAFRSDMRFVPVILTFQKLLGFPETTYSAADATKAFEEYPVLLHELSSHEDVDRVANSGNNHYFALVNRTRWPIRIFSGTAGSNVSNLKFSITVKPNECYTHPCVEKGYAFSAAGTFCVGQDCETMEEMTDVQLVEFAMSNVVTVKQRKILTKLVNTMGNGSQAYQALGVNPDTVKRFLYHSRTCVTQGTVQNASGGYYIWRFCVEEVNLDKL